MQEKQAGSQARETVAAIAMNSGFYYHWDNNHMKYGDDNEAVISFEANEIAVYKKNAAIWVRELDLDNAETLISEAVSYVDELDEEDRIFAKREAAKKEMNRFLDEAWYQRVCALVCQVLLNHDVEFTADAYKGIVRWKNESTHTTYQVWVDYTGCDIDTIIIGKEDGSGYAYDFSWSVANDVQVTEAVLASIR